MRITRKSNIGPWEVEVPEPLANAAGRVYFRDSHGGAEPAIEVILDAAMRPPPYRGGRTIEACLMNKGDERVLFFCGARRDGWPTKGKYRYIRLQGRPDLAALADNYDAIYAAMRATPHPRAAEYTREAKALAARLLAEMHAEADRLARLIPDDHVRVTVTHSYWGDGDDKFDYEVNGMKLKWNTPGLTRHGAAYAHSPGALNPFARVVVASISRTDLDAIRASNTGVG